MQRGKSVTNICMNNNRADLFGNDRKSWSHNAGGDDGDNKPMGRSSSRGNLNDDAGGGGFVMKKSGSRNSIFDNNSNASANSNGFTMKRSGSRNQFDHSTNDNANANGFTMKRSGSRSNIEGDGNNAFNMKK
eukprot:Awhi_evm1s11372